MKRLSLGSWIGTALTLGVLVVACGDDDDPAPRGSAEGESCVRTSDCERGLSCIANFCTSGPGGGEGGSDTGPAPGPVLGGEGESCTRRADCVANLLCIDQRCTDGAPADGGEGNIPAPRLGIRGDSCESVSDCGPGLTCILRMGGGVCDLEDYGLEPSGNVCGGECLAAEDCCELPPVLAAAYTSCEKLVQNRLAGNPRTSCPTTTPIALELAKPCFDYNTYCDCGADTWECANSRCSYTAECTVSGDTWSGCPSFSRTNGALTTTCTDGACSPAANPCMDAADCVGQAPADLAVPCIDASCLCAEDECMCVNERCYVGCDEDLDCPLPFACVENVCTATATCFSDSQCQVLRADVTAECREGTCVTPCARDQDCSDSGVVGGGAAFNAMVCGPDGTCQRLGCTEHEECDAGPVRTFCIEAPAPAAERVRSAVTD